MYRFVVFRAITLAGLAVSGAHSQTVTFIHQFGTEEYDVAAGVAVAGGQVYVYSTTFKEDPYYQRPMTPASLSLRKTGGAGKVLWSREVRCIPDSWAMAFDWSRAMAASSSAIYVTAWSDEEETYICKYGLEGSLRWERKIPRTQVVGTVADATGVYVAGSMEDPITLQSEPFVRKYDSSGNVRWTRFSDSGLGGGAAAIGVDSSGVTVAGFVPNDFGGYDCSLTKYGSGGGKELWTRAIGSCHADVAISVTPVGNIYVLAKESVYPDYSLSKYDTNGAHNWTRPAGSFGYAPRVVASSGSVYVAGNAPGYGGLVRKYESISGKVLWTQTIAADKSAAIVGAAADSTGVVVTGLINGTFPGQTGQGGGADAFAMKLR